MDGGLGYWVSFLFFFFNDTATTEIYTLSLHDALPISRADAARAARRGRRRGPGRRAAAGGDRKSTRLNSSHLVISYAVFCLKKNNRRTPPRSQTSPFQSICMRDPPHLLSLCLPPIATV